jgi:hypothetical protein
MGLSPQSWSSRAFGDHAPAVHRKITTTLQLAHQRMADAHTAGSLRTNHVYGNMFRSVYETLVGEFTEELTSSEDFHMLRIRGYDFLIINNWLLYPVRYADTHKKPDGAKIRPSKLCQAVLTELGPEKAQPSLGPEFDKLADDEEIPSLPEVLEELKDDLKVAIIAFTSSVRAGVMQAYIGQPELNDDRLLWYGRIDQIALIAPPETGQATLPDGPRTSPMPGPAQGGTRFGHGPVPEVSIPPKPRADVPTTEPEVPRPNIQNDE